MEIIPLNEKHLSSTEKLLKKVFNPSKEDMLTLISSLYPEKYKKYLQENGFIELKYFILIEDNQLIGLTGLYAYNKVSYWLGWFCVDDKYRNQGYGKKLLDFAIYKAQNRKFLYLYTEDSDEFKTARKLYKQYGFELYKKDKYLYYKLDFSKTEINTIKKLDYQFREIFNFDELNEIIKKTNIFFENFIFISTDKGSFVITYEWSNNREVKIIFYDKNYTIPPQVISKKEFFNRLRNYNIQKVEFIYVDC